MDDLERQQPKKIREEFQDDFEGLARLSPRERDFLRLRFGLDDERYRDREEIADLYGVTVQRAKGLEAVALRKLRSQ
jgi:RNA polymerase primary sigma factor